MGDREWEPCVQLGRDVAALLRGGRQVESLRTENVDPAALGEPPGETRNSGAQSDLLRPALRRPLHEERRQGKGGQAHDDRHRVGGRL